MIISASPYRADKDLGTAYNELLERLKEGDWAALIDHDAVWTTTVWHEQIARAIEENPEAGLFVSRVSNVGCWWMRQPGVGRGQHDMAYHRLLGARLAEEKGSSVIDVTDFEKIEGGRVQPLSGTLMVISKIAWQAVHGFKKGFLTVDNDMHHRIRKAGFRVLILEGVYLYHWYRFKGRGS